MLVSKYFTVVGSALLAVLFIWDACSREDTEPASSRSTLVVREGLGMDELRLTEDVTPADRIKETFAMFVPADARHQRETARTFARAVKPQA
jgi:hypothetical protein